MNVVWNVTRKGLHEPKFSTSNIIIIFIYYGTSTTIKEGKGGCAGREVSGRHNNSVSGGNKKEKKKLTRHTHTPAYLFSPLPYQDNVGLKLLKLMGYKKGEGLGKSREGITEPIKIEKMTGREGLGVREQKKEKQEQLQELMKMRNDFLEQRRIDYKAAMSDRFTERRLESQLCKGRKTVETLDMREGKQRSQLWWSEEETDNEDDDDHEKRGKEQEEEQREERQDVTEKGQQKDDEATGTEREKEKEMWEAFSTAEKLSVVLTYLREAYHYCLHCGHQYQNAQELEAECPGLTEEEH